MSKRFGRNQKRRLRDELAAERARNEGLEFDAASAKAFLAIAKRSLEVWREHYEYLFHALGHLGEFTAFAPRTRIVSVGFAGYRDGDRRVRVSFARPYELGPRDALAMDDTHTVDFDLRHCYDGRAQR